jgi:hypothetical protein
MITLRFVTGDDPVSRMIAIGERDGWATHVEALMPDGTLLGAHYQGGVLARPVGYDKSTATRELYVTFDAGVDLVPGATPKDPMQPVECEDKFYAFLRAQLGKPYDVTGIGGLALDRDWHSANSWFCSELDAAALEECGYFKPLASINSHISPRDLLLILSGRISIPNMAGNVIPKAST